MFEIPYGILRDPADRIWCIDVSVTLWSLHRRENLSKEKRISCECPLPSLSKRCWRLVLFFEGTLLPAQKIRLFSSWSRINVFVVFINNLPIYKNMIQRPIWIILSFFFVKIELYFLYFLPYVNLIFDLISTREDKMTHWKQLHSQGATARLLRLTDALRSTICKTGNLARQWGPTAHQSSRQLLVSRSLQTSRSSTPRSASRCKELDFGNGVVWRCIWTHSRSMNFAPIASPILITSPVQCSPFVVGRCNRSGRYVANSEFWVKSAPNHPLTKKKGPNSLKLAPPFFIDTDVRQSAQQHVFFDDEVWKSTSVQYKRTWK